MGGSHESARCSRDNEGRIVHLRFVPQEEAQAFRSAKDVYQDSIEIL